MVALSIHATPAFVTALERVKSRQVYKSQSPRLKSFLQELAANQRPLARMWCDHPLKGKLLAFRAAHVAPDLVLLYTLTSSTVELLDIGTHREVYGIE